MKKAVATLLHRGRHALTYGVRRRRFNAMVAAGLPPRAKMPLEFLLDGKVKDEYVARIAAKIEGVRDEMAAQGDARIPVLYSPKPGTRGSDPSASMRPKHGQVLEFTMRQIAHTGKRKRWGVFLHLCATSFQSKTMVELGTCAGISACYLATSPFCERLITVEGSKALAELAQSNLGRVADNAVVYNLLFDDALDTLVPELKDGIDFAFIDGHHEKIATIHYFERLSAKLNTDAVVVFDDISWSQDMREAWESLSQRQGFSHVFDCGEIGLCIWAKDASCTPHYWDLQPVLGRMPIGNPRGWKNR